MFAFVPRYLVTHLMGADLNNIVKCQKLTDDHVQFLIYQILRGLKVRDSPPWGWKFLGNAASSEIQWVHRGASGTSLKYCRIAFYYCSFTSAFLELSISEVTCNFYVFLWAESGKWWTVMPSGLLWLWIFHFFTFCLLVLFHWGCSTPGCS